MLPDMLGWALEDAVLLARQRGYEPILIETKSLHGVEDADSRRVIRQSMDTATGTLTLTWSSFKTGV